MKQRGFQRRLSRVLQRSGVDVDLLLQQDPSCDSFEHLYLSNFQSRLANCLAKHNCSPQHPTPAERKLTSNSRSFVVPATPVHKLDRFSVRNQPVSPDIVVESSQPPLENFSDEEQDQSEASVEADDARDLTRVPLEEGSSVEDLNVSLSQLHLPRKSQISLSPISVVSSDLADDSHFNGFLSQREHSCPTMSCAVVRQLELEDSGKPQTSMKWKTEFLNFMSPKHHEESKDTGENLSDNSDEDEFGCAMTQMTNVSAMLLQSPALDD